MTYAQKILTYHLQTRQPNWKLPKGVELIYPFTEAAPQACMTRFYEKCTGTGL